MALSSEIVSAFDYTLDRYARFLSALRTDGYEFVGFDAVGSEGVRPGELIVRHDVDLSLDRALAMARIEADLGVTSTYCPLVTTPVYNVLTPENRAILGEIEDLGHDVGLHFNTHRRWTDVPSNEVLARAVSDQCRSLDCLLGSSVSIVSFHRPPDWVLGETFDGFDHCYQPEYFSDVTYVSDSNQKWREEPPFVEGVPEAAQILVHPGLWGRESRPLEDVFRRTEREAHEAVQSYVEPMGRWLHRQ